MHLPGVVPGEGGRAAAAVHTHVPPQMRGQVAQDHLVLLALQARARVMSLLPLVVCILTEPGR
jgi:hypothetical protein